MTAERWAPGSCLAGRARPVRGCQSCPNWFRSAHPPARPLSLTSMIRRSVTSATCEVWSIIVGVEGRRGRGGPYDVCGDQVPPVEVAEQVLRPRPAQIDAVLSADHVNMCLVREAPAGDACVGSDAVLLHDGEQ